MSARKVTNTWMRRHIRDPYVLQATQAGYRSRAAFKLIELDRRERLLRPGARVLDLGAAPGGWSQVAAERVGTTGQVVALDLLPVQPLSGVTVIQADVAAEQAYLQAAAALGEGGADLVLSDMAPNLTGIRAADEARSQALARVALQFARRLLKPGGCLLVKIFHGAGLDEVITEARAQYREVATRKPSASRPESRESYLVCRRRLPC